MRPSARKPTRRAKRSGKKDAPAAPDASAEAAPIPAQEALPPLALFSPYVAAAVAFLVYLPHLCPTLAILGDSAVFVTSSAVWGVPQPSGYPLYTLLGHLMSVLPFGEVAWRVHLTSTIYHAVTVGLVAHIIGRLTRSPLAAALGALHFAFSRAFFHGSLYAEVFALNDLFTAWTLVVALQIHDTDRGNERSSFRALLLFAALAGVASSHHQMIALTTPALALLVGGCAIRLVRSQPSRLLGMLGLFLGLIVSIYGLVPICAGRDPFLSWGDVQNGSDLLRLATRQDFGGLFSPTLQPVGGQAIERGSVYLAGFWRSFGPLGLAMGIFGAVWLWHRHRRVTAALAVMFVVAGPLFAMVNAIPVHNEHGVAFAERFSTMSHVPWAILAGGGLGAILHALKNRSVPSSVVRIGASLVALIPLIQNSPDVDLHEDRLGLAFARDLLRPVPQGALVLVAGDARIGATAYACAVEGLCEGRVIMSPGQIHMSWRVRQLRRRHPDLILPEPQGRFLRTDELVAANIGHRPVYVTPELLDLQPALRTQYAFLPEMLLLRVYEVNRPVEDLREPFLLAARRLIEGSGCEGCGASRDQLRYPSLETPIFNAYGLAYENHARIARHVFGAHWEANRLSALAKRTGL